MKKIHWLSFIVCGSLVAGIGHAAERKAIEDIDANALTSDGQVTQGGNNSLDLIWWIPTEFWETSIRSNPAVSKVQADRTIDALRPYSVLGVVQADISDFGAFAFFDEESISDSMVVEHIDEDGRSAVISHTESADPDVILILNQMVPVLAAAMGNLGENFYFFPMPDINEDGHRLVSPYEKGKLQITLNAREDAAPTTLEIELPLDSLHIPRLCPNGKPAHVAWQFCPWSGKKLD